jgi:hypothetical protein
MVKGCTNSFDFSLKGASLVCVMFLSLAILNTMLGRGEAAGQVCCSILWWNSCFIVLLFKSESRTRVQLTYRHFPINPLAQWPLYVPPSLAFINSTFCPHIVFMCFVWISEQTAITCLYCSNWLVFITEKRVLTHDSGYCNSLRFVSL